MIDLENALTQALQKSPYIIVIEAINRRGEPRDEPYRAAAKDLVSRINKSGVEQAKILSTGEKENEE